MRDFLSDSDVGCLIDVLEQAKTVGLLGPGPVEAHIEHARRFWSASPIVPSMALDLGSGGGVPGLVLAMAWPESSWVLLDARERSSAFLSTALGELGLERRVEVLRGRAEEVARELLHRHSFQLVTARGFAPPAETAECATGFVARGGYLLVSEPPDDEDRWSSEGLALLQMARVSSKDTFIAVIQQVAICSERFPRRSGVPAKRPLF